jgi:flagellar hook protein FlgE
MLQGEGFFVLKDSTGNVYLTRNGNFTTDSVGDLVDASTGYQVQGYASTVSGTTVSWPDLTGATVPDSDKINLEIGMLDTSGHATTANHKLTSFTIDSSGVVTGTFSDVTGAADAYTTPLYKIALATCNNPAGLNPVGNTYYQESPNSGTININYVGQNGNKFVTPGALEMSNVDLSQQFTDMIVTQRGFQANQGLLQFLTHCSRSLLTLNGNRNIK